MRLKAGALSECAFGTVLHAFHTKNAFGSVFPFSGIIRYVYVHRTHALAFSAGDALFLVAFHPEKSEIAHGFQEYGDGTEIFAERAVVF